MSTRATCRHCGAPQTRLLTDGHGGIVQVATPCSCVKRKAAGLCRTCPAPLPGPLATYCPTCADRRRRESFRRHQAKKAGRALGAAPEWRKDVNEERRLAGICQLCIRPATGKPKIALYCDRCRKLRREDAQRKHKRKVGNKHGRKFYATHREEILAAQRERHAKDWRARKRKAEYKRKWRKENRDKVRAQKRRSALRGKSAEAARRHRELHGRTSRNPARRNERGERLCNCGDCQAVVTGRAKMCAGCKANPSHQHARQVAA